jgi:hypothetical protein
MVRMRAGVVLIALSGLASAAQAPKVLLELYERAAGGTSDPERLSFRVLDDGRFETAESDGTLTAPQLGELKLLLSYAKIEMLPGFNACDAIAMSHSRLVTARGALEWEAPCSAEPHPSVLKVIELAHKLIQARSLARFVERQKLTGEHWKSDVVIERSGAWHRGEHHGLLSEAQMAELSRAVFQLEECPVVEGDALLQIWLWPTSMIMQEHCATQPVKLLDKLTAQAPPVLVSLERAVSEPRFWPLAILFTDGRFVVHEVAGKLSAAQLATWKRAVAAAKLKLQPEESSPGCAVPPPGVFRVRTAAGEVQHRPCKDPPHPTVAKLEDNLLKLSGSQRLLSVDARPGGRFEIFSDGVMQVDGKPLKIHPSNASSLGGQVIGATFTVARKPQCRARETRRVLVSAPGYGQLMWSEPCEEPHPTVKALYERSIVLRASAVVP